MRKLRLEASNPAVKKAALLNARLSAAGFDHSHPVESQEYINSDGVMCILYAQTKNGLFRRLRLAVFGK